MTGGAEAEYALPGDGSINRALLGSRPKWLFSPEGTAVTPLIFQSPFVAFCYKVRQHPPPSLFVASWSPFPACTLSDECPPPLRAIVSKSELTMGEVEVQYKPKHIHPTTHSTGGAPISLSLYAAYLPG